MQEVPVYVYSNGHLDLAGLVGATGRMVVVAFLPEPDVTPVCHNEYH